MRPLPCVSGVVAFCGLLRSRTNPSSTSTAVSPVIATVTFCAAVDPGGKVTTPDAATKSSPAVALPDAVAYARLTCRLLGAESARRNTHGPEPASPSTLPQSSTSTSGGASSSRMVPTACASPRVALTAPVSVTL